MISFWRFWGVRDFHQQIARVDADADTLPLQSNQLYRDLRSSGEAFSDELYVLLQMRLPRWTAGFQKRIVFGC